jgi:hypothetical protein
VTLEPSSAGRRARCLRAHGDTGALSWRVACFVPRDDTGALSWQVVCSVPQDTWRSQSSLAPGAGLEPWDTSFKSCAHGYPICRVPTVALGPTLGEATNP